jgi:hypothetical protein
MRWWWCSVTVPRRHRRYWFAVISQCCLASWTGPIRNNILQLAVYTVAVGPDSRKHTVRDACNESSLTLLRIRQTTQVGRITTSTEGARGGNNDREICATQDTDTIRRFRDDEKGKRRESKPRTNPEPHACACT